MNEIQGLKVKVLGSEVSALCQKQVDYHDERAEMYRKKVDDFKSSGVEPMNYTNGDPVRQLEEKMEEHRSKSAELAFFAKYTDQEAVYILEREDLKRLGVVSGKVYF